MKHKLYIIGLLLGLLFIGSCGKCNLYYPPVIGRVFFVTDKATQELFPYGKAAIYTNGAIIANETKEIDSLYFDLPIGTYDVILYAHGDNIQFRNIENYNTAEAYLETIGLNKTKGNLIPNADSLYDVTFNKLEVTKGEKQIPTQLFSLTKSFTAVIALDQNKEIKNISARLTGVAQSINLSTKRAQYVKDLYVTGLQIIDKKTQQLTLTCTYFGVTPKPDMTTPETPNHKKDIIVDITYDDNTNESIEGELGDIFDKLDPDNGGTDIVVSLAKIGTRAVVVGWNTGSGNGIIPEK